jgi:hypothetical protein
MDKKSRCKESERKSCLVAGIVNMERKCGSKPERGTAFKARYHRKRQSKIMKRGCSVSCSPDQNPVVDAFFRRNMVPKDVFREWPQD